MKNKIAVFLVMTILVLSVTASALTSGEAKQKWLDIKEKSMGAQTKHNDAKLAWATNKSAENDKKVVDTGKDVLNFALDEVEAWLNWKKAEAEETKDIPSSLKDSIKQDADINLAKIGPLRTDVSNIKNQLGLGVTFLKMIGKYFELVADTARNSGKIWAYKSGKYADTIGDYESKLRAIADKLSDNKDIIAKLDSADSELKTARNNIKNAENAYALVKIPGTPVLKFSEGNSYLKAAQANLITAQGYLLQAYSLIVSRGG